MIWCCCGGECLACNSQFGFGLAPHVNLFQTCATLCAICEVVGLCSDNAGRESSFNGKTFYLLFDGNDLFYRKDRSDGLEIEWKLDTGTVLNAPWGFPHYATEYIVFRDTRRGTEIRITCNANDSTVEGCPDPFDPATDCPRFNIRAASTFGYYTEDDCTHLAGIIRDGDLTPCLCHFDWTSPGNLPTLAFANATIIDGYAFQITLSLTQVFGGVFFESWVSEFLTQFSQQAPGINDVAHHSVNGSVCALDCFVPCTEEGPVFSCSVDCGGPVTLSVELVLT